MAADVRCGALRLCLMLGTNCYYVLFSPPSNALAPFPLSTYLIHGQRYTLQGAPCVISRLLPPPDSLQSFSRYHPASVLRNVLD